MKENDRNSALKSLLFGNFQESYVLLSQKTERKKAVNTWFTALYPGRDLNPHARDEHRILSPACLPIPPPGRRGCEF